MNIINRKNGMNVLMAGLLPLVLLACSSSAQNESTSVSKQLIDRETVAVQEQNNTNKPVIITSAQYVELVADFRKDKEWKFKGKNACVVDFYADWCRPCKMMEPAFEKAAEKYAGKVNFYKINVDFNKDIASAYQITGIPTLFFCSTDGKVTRISGALSEEQINAYVEAIASK
ncbi:MAG: thioredoxin [Bacteroidales bacterium]|jgi:thioredoxin|nr:thioredoxin [Bacteroidales bacterium]